MTQRAAAAARARASARLGRALRTALFAPRAGIAAALQLAERRARTGRRPGEGVAPYALAAVAGAATLTLWLKLSVAAGARTVCPQDYRAAYVGVSVLVGAVLGVVAVLAWGLAGRAVRGPGGAAPPSSLRLVWGAAALPQVAGVLVLLPLDLAVVGPETFTSAPIDGTGAAVWAALSIAFAVALAGWSLVILWRGVEVAARTTAPRAAAAIPLALATTAIVFGGFVAAASVAGAQPSCAG
ncbi:MAG TPA: hypothetical protein VHJ34_10975 [Actinomycetota bacterium]|nr:hypothetical protein [Actinomycetota bacterium]